MAKLSFPWGKTQKICGLGIAPSSSYMRIFDSMGGQRLILFLTLLFTFYALSTEIKGQSSAQKRANDRRAQLAEARAKQENLETRLKQLEDELRPENIEKSLAGIGSTHPEDLREFRRRQLELEKMNTQTQLKFLAESQTRLEAGILQADADAYHQSAGVNTGRQEPSAMQQVRPSRVQRGTRRTRHKPKRRPIRRLIQD
jgi:hypothetical protein